MIRTLKVVAAVLMITVIIRFTLADGLDSKRRVSTPFEPASLVGRLADLKVTYRSETASTPLSEWSQGACTYVFIYRDGCAPCRQALYRLLADAPPPAPLVPSGWQFAFLILDTIPDSHIITSDTTRWFLLQVEGGSAMASEWGLSATPAHLVMDANGVIVDAAMGARAWNLSSFNTDCTMDTIR